MVVEGLVRGAKTLILVVLISAIAAGILTVAIWTQPMFIEMLIAGDFWFLLSTFMTCWVLSSIISWMLVFCVTRNTGGSVPQTVGG